MKQTIFFDLDDTLIYCNKYFHLVLDLFVDEMVAWFAAAGVTAAAIRQKQEEIDIARVSVEGFASEHFPLALVDTYRYFCGLTGRPGSAREEAKLMRLGRSVFDLENEPYPHMEETLDKLASSGHELHLYTGGDPAIQHRKIERLKLRRYFNERIYIRVRKNTLAMEQILATGRFARDSTWMIGNSVRTDILPALECGLNAVYMKQEAEWSYNVLPIDAKPAGAFLTLSALHQVPAAIHQYLTALRA